MDQTLITVATETLRNFLEILKSPSSLVRMTSLTFRLGGPASGKGTQCAKLVEEFGYTHISVGDLMRAEKDKVRIFPFRSQCHHSLGNQRRRTHQKDHE